MRAVHAGSAFRTAAALSAVFDCLILHSTEATARVRSLIESSLQKTIRSRTSKPQKRVVYAGHSGTFKTVCLPGIDIAEVMPAYIGPRNRYLLNRLRYYCAGHADLLEYVDIMERLELHIARIQQIDYNDVRLRVMAMRRLVSDSANKLANLKGLTLVVPLPRGMETNGPFDARALAALSPGERVALTAMNDHHGRSPDIVFRNFRSDSQRQTALLKSLYVGALWADLVETQRWIATRNDFSPAVTELATGICEDMRAICFRLHKPKWKPFARTEKCATVRSLDDSTQLMLGALQFLNTTRQKNSRSDLKVEADVVAGLSWETLDAILTRLDGDEHLGGEGNSLKSIQTFENLHDFARSCCLEKLVSLLSGSHGNGFEHLDAGTARYGALLNDWQRKLQNSGGATELPEILLQVFDRLVAHVDPPFAEQATDFASLPMSVLFEITEYLMTRAQCFDLMVALAALNKENPHPSWPLLLEKYRSTVNKMADAILQIETIEETKLKRESRFGFSSILRLLRRPRAARPCPDVVNMVSSKLATIRRFAFDLAE